MVPLRFAYGHLGSLPPRLAYANARSRSYSPTFNAPHSCLHTPLAQVPSLHQLNSLSSEQAVQVSIYIDSLLDWNQRMNLTAVTERSSIMERHIADSLALLPVMETTFGKYNPTTIGDSLKVVDVGSGAGLPGIILAIARPSWEVTLLESLQKRCNFLAHVIEALSLDNVKLVRARAEDAGHDMSFRECFDVSVARAVAEMRVLVELCLPFVRVGGLLVAAKGANPEEEVKAAKGAAHLLGASILPIARVTSLSPNGQRTAILCHKERATPKRGFKMLCPYATLQGLLMDFPRFKRLY
ncbi:hypothetical protein GOP47_0010076 [Adiantum capillus-veneris]|uniref:Ribosomal RNA small subunit methyltransferase G n=1 Tax=Adiantum capillus-veneris TaxID=13818 RepID=A0A9D4UU22_ADICA|nr:hypothetical protein GOP47_0010076 [Adiantum capillus-veneris]